MEELEPSRNKNDPPFRQTIINIAKKLKSFANGSKSIDSGQSFAR